MKNAKDRKTSMTIPARIDFTPAVTQGVETFATAYGMGHDESLKLRLAAEEIFAYLCTYVCPEESVEILCSNHIYFTRVEFHFAFENLDLGALNITAAFSENEDDYLSKIGLRLVTKTVSRLFLTSNSKNRAVLAIEEDRIYPQLQDTLPLPVDIVGEIMTAKPDYDNIKRYIMQARRLSGKPLMPVFLNYPGRIADMVESGDCKAFVALDSADNIAGGILCLSRYDNYQEVTALHIFSERRYDELARKLMDASIMNLVNTKTIGLINFSGMPETLETQFEHIGSFACFTPENEIFERPVSIRLLHEDPGCRVWIHPCLRKFIEEEYERLVLAREIMDISDQVDTPLESSIFSAEINRSIYAEAILKPEWPGRDYDANIKRHLQMFEKNRFKHIFVTIDLGVSWHAQLIPCLLENNFRPRVVIPFGGKADVIAFQYDRY